MNIFVKFIRTIRLEWVLLFLVLVYVWLFFWHWELFYESDLGRHLTNGKLLISTGVIPRVNLYAYSYGDFPTVTHHWLSGAIYYLVETKFGFRALAVLSSLIYLGAISLGVVNNFSKNKWVYSLFSLLVLLPILTIRFDIRPEQFSYLFLTIELLILTRWIRNKLTDGWLLVLVLIQILWINLHIYFAIGLVMQAWFVFGLLLHKDLKKMKKLGLVCLVAVVTSLLNPFGLKGLVEPFGILNGIQLDYVVENIGLLNYTMLFGDKKLMFFLDLFLVVTVLVGASWKKKWIKPYRVEMIWSVGLGLLGIFMVRNAALFGYGLLTLAPGWISGFMKSIRREQQIQKLMLMLIVIVVPLGLWGKMGIYSPYSYDFGLMKAPGVDRGGEFLAQQDDIGNVFNNYDVGGYLIYHLFPFTRVFVDNRPEAYPSSFFYQLYIGALTDEHVWYELDGLVRFNTIVFSKADRSSAVGRFVQRRMQSGKWELWYEDEYLLVLRQLERKS